MNFAAFEPVADLHAAERGHGARPLHHRHVGPALDGDRRDRRRRRLRFGRADGEVRLGRSLPAVVLSAALAGALVGTVLALITLEDARLHPQAHDARLRRGARASSPSTGTTSAAPTASPGIGLKTSDLDVRARRR